MIEGWPMAGVSDADVSVAVHRLAGLLADSPALDAALEELVRLVP
jgi:hypothetical protein